MEITAWPPLSTCPLLLQTSRDQSRSLMLSLKPICLSYCTPHPCVPVLTHVLTHVLHRPHILLCRSWLQHDTTVPLLAPITNKDTFDPRCIFPSTFSKQTWRMMSSFTAWSHTAAGWSPASHIHVWQHPLFTLQSKSRWCLHYRTSSVICTPSAAINWI